MEQPTARTQAKAERRSAILTAGAQLFARRGFRGVTLEELGAAAGVSGPALYRHFPGKQALLGSLLVGVSGELLAGGRAVIARTLDAGTALNALIAFHVAFALDSPEVIRVQDRDFESLSEADQNQVRALQRAYVELWVQTLGRVFPHRAEDVRRIQVHAVFGLINSTPHSVQLPSPTGTARRVLESMAWAGLSSPARVEGPAE